MGCDLEFTETAGAAAPPSPSPFNPLVDEDVDEDVEEEVEEELTAGAGVNVNSEGVA